MAQKGARTTQKRISAGTQAKIARKEYTWTFRTLSGPHGKDRSIPLGRVLRDFLTLGKTAKDVRFIMQHGAVKVDGRIRKDLQLPVGLFDVVSVGEKQYRIAMDYKGRLVPVEINAKSAAHKLCRVMAKQVRGKEFLLTTHDGRTLKSTQNAIRPGDSLKISVPQQEILEHVPLAAGNSVMVVGGKRAGSLAGIASIVTGTISRKRLVNLNAADDVFQTVDENVFVVGKDKPLVEAHA